MKTRNLLSLPWGTVLMLAMATPVAAMSINKSINIGDGEEAGGQSSVNGSITVGSNAAIDGGLDTVNGRIRVGDDSRVGKVHTVNGSIRLGDRVTSRDVDSVNGGIHLGSGVQVDGEINIVNGEIKTESGTTIADDVENVNGEISLTGSEVGGNVTTVNGDVSLLDGTTVDGDLVVEEPGGWNWNRNRRVPRIVIGANSRVAGTIRLERKVELFISDSAEVGGVSGEMSMDDAVRFSGDRP